MEKGKSEGGMGEVGLEAGGEGAREESIRRRQSPSSTQQNRTQDVINNAKQYYTTLLGAIKTLTAVEDKHAIVPRHEGIEQGAK